MSVPVMWKRLFLGRPSATDQLTVQFTLYLPENARDVFTSRQKESPDELVWCPIDWC